MKQNVGKILAQEIEDRETLDAEYYRVVKQPSIDRALARGIAPEMVAQLYNPKS